MNNYNKFLINKYHEYLELPNGIDISFDKYLEIWYKWD